MKYAQILCILSGAHSDEATILAAAELAKRDSAVVRVIPSLPLTEAILWADAFGTNYIAASTVDEIAAGHAQMRADMALLVQRTVDALGLSHHAASAPAIVLPLEPASNAEPQRAGAMGELAVMTRDPVWKLLDREGPLTDLVVVGEGTVQSEGFWTSSPGQALMGLRCPMLVVRAAETIEGGVVAIAWDGSLAAGRAVRGALPVLAAAQRLIILQDPDGMSAAEKAAGAPDRLIAYLALHGIARPEVKILSGRREGKALLAAADAEGAGILVAGAFGHSQAREFLFGGTTRTLAKGDAGPHLLMAH